MSQEQISFIGKITNWLKSLFQKKEKVMETIEDIIEVVENLEEAIQVVSPKNADKLKKVSETIDAAIDTVRETNETVNKAAKKVKVIMDTAEVVESTFKKGRFDEIEIATITNAVVVAGNLEVDWNTLSTNLNRDIKAIKAKAKLLSK